MFCEMYQITGQPSVLYYAGPILQVLQISSLNFVTTSTFNLPSLLKFIEILIR